jgi:hypothetical protein
MLCAGYELMRPRFERMLTSLREKNPRAGAWLDKIPKEKWAQSYDEGRRYGHMTTNLAECFNGVLKGSRALPITALVKATFYRLTSWHSHHKDEARTMLMAGHRYCEELSKAIAENNRKARSHVVRSFSREYGIAEVEAATSAGSRRSSVFTVRLQEMWCDCGEFQSLRFPCSHAVATCASVNLNYDQFISPIYRLDYLVRVYGVDFQPIGNEEYWPPYAGPTFVPNQSLRRFKKGRPTTKRIHNEMDELEPQQKKCSACRSYGHDKRRCPYWNTQVGESSTRNL